MIRSELTSNSSPAARDGRASSGVRVNGASCPVAVVGGFVLFCFIGVLDLYCGFKASLVVLSKSSQVKVSCLS